MLALALGLLALAIQLVVSAAYKHVWTHWEPTSPANCVEVVLLAAAVALLIRAFRHH